MKSPTQDIFEQVNREIEEEFDYEPMFEPSEDTYDAPFEQHDSIREVVDALLETADTRALLELMDSLEVN